MLDEAAMAVVSGAAGNIVAYMLNGRVDALRVWISGIFQGGTDEERRVSMRGLEEDRVALAARSSSADAVMARWTHLLAAHLAAHPEAGDQLRALAADRPAKTVLIHAQHNHSSGTFIGGDNYGSITPAREADR